MSGEPQLLVVRDPDHVAIAARALVLRAEREALANCGKFCLALCGGSTPRNLYQLLAASTDFDFANWHVFFGDERWVAADDPQSNLRMARETLLDHVPIPERQIHAVDTTAGSPERAAALYAMTIRRRVASVAGGIPRLDLALLGLGSDGHTASLFPGSSALTAKASEVAVATWAPTPQAWRITMTAGVLSNARNVVFVVCGADKADALANVLEGESDSAPPAVRIRPTDGTLTFVVDEAAASDLRNSL